MGRLAAQRIFHHPVEALPGGRRQGHSDDLLQLVNGPRRAGTHADDAPVRAGVDRLLDRVFRLLQQMGHRASADIVLGMSVGVDALQVLYVLLDQVQTPAGGCVIGIHHQSFAEGRRDGGVGADDLAAQKVEFQCATGVHSESFHKLG